MTRRTRAGLWASMLLMAAGAACDEQHDLVAIARILDACSGDDCKPKLDAGPMQMPPVDACAGDSCEAPMHDACAEADGCTPPEVDADACADPRGCPAPMQCKARVCSETGDHALFCQSTEPAVALGDSCAGPDKNPSFRYALCIRQDLVTSGELQIDGDVSVDSVDNNTISFGADAHIAGVLRYGGSKPPAAPSVTLEARGGIEHSDPNCAVDAALGFDLDAAIRAAEASNDNASNGDPLAKLANITGDTTVTLPCGRYLASGLQGDGKLTLHASGNVVVLVKGNVQLERGFLFDATPNARITLIVSGGFYVKGGFTLGDASANRHILAVGNGLTPDSNIKQIHFNAGTNVVGGSIYAPTIQLLTTSAPLQVNGAVLVYNANITDKLQIHADAAATAAANSCGVSP